MVGLCLREGRLVSHMVYGSLFLLYTIFFDVNRDLQWAIGLSVHSYFLPYIDLLESEE